MLLEPQRPLLPRDLREGGFILVLGRAAQPLAQQSHSANGGPTGPTVPPVTAAMKLRLADFWTRGRCLKVVIQMVRI
jgi:hypothetical protein